MCSCVTAANAPKAPPVRVIRTIDRLRAGLHRLGQSLAPGNVGVLDLITGGWNTQSVYVAAKLGIADELAGGPRSARDVARQVGSDPDATYRLMRALAGRGVLRHRRDDTFALTRIGQALRSDTDGSLRDMALFIGHPTHWQGWGQLLHAVRTGETATRKLHGTGFFEHLGTDPELAEVFNNAMTAMNALARDALVAAYDFTGFRRIVDVGGGHGGLLGAILAGAPDAHGVLYDLPSVVAGAGPVLRAAGVADRCTVADGSFLDSVPAGGDAYVLKSIIHDWDENAGLAILRNVRAAIDPDGKLLLLEMVLPDRASAHFGEMLDLEMLVTAGGRERTRTEYAELLRRAGFRLKRVIDTGSPMAIVEAVPA